eukprot:277051_1
MENKQKQLLDEEIFHQQQKQESKCSKDTNTDAVQNCQHLVRIAHSIKYFQILPKQLFIQFVVTSYPMCLDDYIHFMSMHSDTHSVGNILTHLWKNHEFKKCENIKECKLTQQHFRDRQNDENHEYHFYIELFNTLHFFIEHFNTIRSLALQSAKIKEESNCIMQKDVQLKRTLLTDVFSTHRKITERINKMKSRFNIAINQYTLPTELSKNTEESQNTFIDDMFIYLQQNNIDNTELNKLKQYLDEEEFCTDSIMFDYINESMHVIDPNMTNNTQYIECMMCIKSFINHHLKSKHMFDGMFSTGFVLFYWKWYEQHIDDIEMFKQEQSGALRTNENDFGGYSIRDLFVSKHYSSLKSEALNSGYISICVLNKKVFSKAKQYMNTNKVRNIKCIHGEDGDNPDPLHFGIAFAEPVKEYYFHSLILYTDFTDFSSKFSSTFRAIYFRESIRSITNRNKKFYHISKYLRELVQYFGINGNYTINGEETGDFYCGMDFVCHLPSFSIRLNGPISTSKDKEIAVRFATRDGMIMCLNNSNWPSNQEVFFNSKWISCYPEEDERTFFGGRYTLQLARVLVVETRNNYDMRIFYAFDKMLSGNWSETEDTQVAKSDVTAIQAFIDHYLKIKTNNFGDYINKTFHLFCNQKTQIILNLYQMDKLIKCKTFVGLIMHSVKPQKQFYNNNTNIFKSLLFSLFPNGKEIVIYATDSYNGGNIYAFNIEYLLNNILHLYSSSSSTQSFTKITIKAQEAKQYESEFEYENDGHSEDDSDSLCVDNDGDQTERYTWISTQFECLKFRQKKRKRTSLIRNQGLNKNEDWFVIRLSDII